MQMSESDMTQQVSSWSVRFDHCVPSTAATLSLALHLHVILSASLTRNVFGPANDDDQLAVSKVTEGCERALGRVGLQRVGHGK